MAAPEELVEKLALESIALFPGAMHWPLVAAGIVRAGTAEFLARSVNVMKLTSTAFRLVHAEEVLFEACATTSEDVELVITLEPCQERQGEGEAETPCCDRIVAFARRNPARLKRVVVGAYSDGRGIEVIAGERLPVVLLHGPEHAQHIVKNVQGRVREIGPKGRGGTVEVREVASLDPLNREAYGRRWQFKKEREDATEAILTWLVLESSDPAADLVDGLLTRFGTVFGEQHRSTLVARVPSFRPSPDQPIDPRRARGFLYHAVSRALYRDRSIRAEAELRTRVARGGQT